MDNRLKTDSQFLSWEITRTEKKTRTRKFILAASIPFILLCVNFLMSFSARRHFDNFWSWSMIIYAIAGIVLTFVLWLLFNEFFPYPNRTYYLNKEGLTISKNRKKKHFAWNEFEYFYRYEGVHYGKSTENLPREKLMKDLYAAAENTEEKIFYLLKKPPFKFLGRFCKTFVILYAEPDISEQVFNFLLERLPEKKMGLLPSLSEFGLVFYQFK